MQGAAGHPFEFLLTYPRAPSVIQLWKDPFNEGDCISNLVRAVVSISLGLRQHDPARNWIGILDSGGLDHGASKCGLESVAS